MKIKLIIWNLLLSTLLIAQEGQVIDRIVAIINDEIILQSEVEQTTNLRAIQSQVDPRKDPIRYQLLRQETLQMMIDEKILLAKAKLDSIQVDNKQVEQVLDQRITQIVSQLGSEQKLEEYYGYPIKKIKKDYRNQVRNSLMVDELRRKHFSNIKTSRREVEQFYFIHQDSLPDLPNSVDISHILLSPNPSSKARFEALKKISDFLAQIKTGTDFSEMAKKYSEDPGSASNGGELGFFSRGDFVPEFEEVAFSLQPGQISEVVESKFGFHIIQMIERRGEKINVRQILITLRPTEEDIKTVIDTLRAVRDKALQGTGWADLAVQYSEDPEAKENKGHLGEFETTSLQLPEFKQVIDDMQPGDVSLPFRTDYGYHIIRLNNRQDSRPLSLEKDWEKVENLTLTYKQSLEYKKWIEELRKDIYIDIKK